MRLPIALAGVASLAALSVACAGSSEASGKPKPGPAVQRTGLMSVARAAHGAALLPSGRVILVGGCTLPGCDDGDFQTDTAELYDPKTRRFSATAKLHRIRINPEVETLPDGRVLVAGGYSGTKPTAAVELYDESTATFTDVQPMLSPRADGTSTRLRDGRILFAGGDAGDGALASAELYDPASGRFTPTGSMAKPRKVHAATLLADGRVLLTGGATTGGTVVRTAELYDPKTNRFTPTGSLARIRYKHGSAGLGDGRVLVVGGAPVFDLGLRYRGTEIYDPRTGRFSRGPAMQTGRYHVLEAVLALPRGRVLVAGDSVRLEQYEPAPRRFRPVGVVGQELGFSVALRLKDGSVLIAGGYSSLGENPVRRAWTYRPG